MYKIILSLSIIFSVYQLKSQGNLQFNQVLNYNLFVTSTSAGIRTQTISVTVPTGKVWKVEYCSASLPNSTISVGGDFRNLKLNIDNVNCFCNNGNFLHQLVTPLWLNEGMHSLSLSFYYNYSGSDNGGAYGKVSIIEFNVVP